MDELGSVPGLRAEAGSRPACESLSFASPKERNQRKGDPTVCVPCASLRGNLRCSGLAGSRSNSLRFTSLRQSRALIRQTLRSSAHPEGHWGQNIHTGHCFARPRLRSARRLRPSGLGRAQQWPVWLSGFQVPFRMRRGAQRPADQGSRLSERSEFERDPAGCEHRRLPAAKRRDAACRVAFSWLTFFWRGKRK